MASTSTAPMTGSSFGGGATTAKDEPTRQVPLTLRTTEATLSIPNVPYLIPTSWRRSQLSTLVNRLLQTSQNGTSAAVPFDFIVDGQLLRTSISQYLESKGLTEESTLDIEYIRSTLPPTFTASFEHDDWISAVDATLDAHILTSSYDGSLRVFGRSTVDHAVLTFQPTPSAPLTSARWLPSELSSSSSSSSSARVAAVGMDGGLRVCQVDMAEGSTPTARLESLSFTGAFETPSPLSSVAVNRRGDTLATAGWDGCVAVWDGESKEGRTTKRRKGTNGASTTDETATMKPLTLFWHTSPAMGSDRLPSANARIAAVQWNADRSVISAGWDGSVKVWDVGAGACSTTKTSDKVILTADVMNGSQGEYVVTGHMDRSAGLWDVRTSSTTNVSIAFNNAHAAPVGVVRAHPMSSHLFVSGAYDETVKLWDTRSPRAALFSLLRPSSSPSATGKKILALDWDTSGQTVVAGGEECQLTVHRGEGIGREAVEDTSITN